MTESVDPKRLRDVASDLKQGALYGDEHTIVSQAADALNDALGLIDRYERALTLIRDASPATSYLGGLARNALEPSRESGRDLSL